MTHWALYAADDVSQTLGRLLACKAKNLRHQLGRYLPFEKLTGNDDADLCGYDGATLEYYTE